jgi:hypothetical protein
VQRKKKAGLASELAVHKVEMLSFNLRISYSHKNPCDNFSSSARHKGMVLFSTSLAIA